MNNKSSIGLIKPSSVKFDNSLLLECGKELKGFEMVYETYGKLNEEKSNAILVCHALSGSHHAAGYHKDSEEKAGWWDSLIGPNKAIEIEGLCKQEWEKNLSLLIGVKIT